jgi:hypothetical protein
VAELNLLAGEVQHYRTVSQPLAISVVPDQPTAGELAAAECLKPAGVRDGDNAAAAKPVRLAARDAEIRRPAGLGTSAQAASLSDLMRLSSTNVLVRQQDRRPGDSMELHTRCRGFALHRRRWPLQRGKPVDPMPDRIRGRAVRSARWGYDERASSVSRCGL